MKKRILLCGIVIIFLMSGYAMAADTELQDEVESLKAVVQELKDEVRELKAKDKEKPVRISQKHKFLDNISMGADFRVRSLYAQGSDSSAEDSVSGFDQRLRVSLDYVDESGVALRTRTYLYENNWLGDRRASGGAGSDIDSGEDNIALDYGYIDIPFAETWKFTTGRMPANWAFNFVTDDDRRDRIMLSNNFGQTAIGNVTALAIYDKRQEGLINIRKDDGDMYALATVTQTGNWQWGLLLDCWHGYADYQGINPGDPDGYVLDELWSFAPFVYSKIEDLELSWALHYMDGNGDDRGFWSNQSYSTFIRMGYDLAPFKVEVQGMYVSDGALVGAGWDSFSCLIQNDLRNDPNPIKLSGVGGIGVDDDDQWLTALRFSGRLFDNAVGWSVAGGYVDTENDSPGNLYGLKEAFFDIQGSYRFLKTLEVFGKAGIFTGDEDEGEETGAGRWGGLMGLSWNY